jgi:hypothetical protein
VHGAAENPPPSRQYSIMAWTIKHIILDISSSHVKNLNKYMHLLY